MAVDGAIVDIDLVVIGRIHQGIAALDHARALGEGMQDEELGDGEHHGLALPGAGMAFGIHAQQATFQDLGVRSLGSRGILGLETAQDRLHTLHQQALREGFADEIVGAHLQAEQFVDLLVLGGEEDHRQLGLLAQAAQQLHAVHAGHLDVEDGEIRRIGLQAVKSRHAVIVGLDAIAFRLQRDGNGGQNVAVVIDQRNRRHCNPFMTRCNRQRLL